MFSCETTSSDQYQIRNVNCDHHDGGLSLAAVLASYPGISSPGIIPWSQDTYESNKIVKHSIASCTYVICLTPNSTADRLTDESVKNDPFEGLVVPLHSFEDLSLKFKAPKFNGTST